MSHRPGPQCPQRRAEQHLKKKELTASEGGTCADGADAQKLLPGNPLLEELADVGGNSNAARRDAKPPFLDNAHTMSSLCEDEGDCEAGESCEVH